MALGGFVTINLLVMKYFSIPFVYILNFFESLKLKSTQILRPQNLISGSAAFVFEYNFIKEKRYYQKILKKM